MPTISHESCIAACRECVTTCESWLRQGLACASGGAGGHCAELCQSAIRLCQLVVEELKLHSAFSIQICALGTVICRACAEECAAHPDPAGRACAAACARAAEECHAVATMTRSL
jgi:hypothetical protein